MQFTFVWTTLIWLVIEYFVLIQFRFELIRPMWEYTFFAIRWVNSTTELHWSVHFGCANALKCKIQIIVASNMANIFAWLIFLWFNSFWMFAAFASSWCECIASVSVSSCPNSNKTPTKIKQPTKFSIILWNFVEKSIIRSHDHAFGFHFEYVQLFAFS